MTFLAFDINHLEIFPKYGEVTTNIFAKERLEKHGEKIQVHLKQKSTKRLFFVAKQGPFQHFGSRACYARGNS